MSPLLVIFAKDDGFVMAMQSTAQPCCRIMFVAGSWRISV